MRCVLGRPWRLTLTLTGVERTVLQSPRLVSTTAAPPAPAPPPRREFPDSPRVGVAATVLSPHGRQVLLVRRRNPPGAGSWSLPGGLLDLGEDVVDAALREVLEETSIEARSAVPFPVTGTASPKFFVTEVISHEQQPVHSLARPMAQPTRVQYHYVLVHVLCFADDALQPIAADDASDAKWFDAAAVAEVSVHGAVASPNKSSADGERSADMGSVSENVRHVVSAALQLHSTGALVPPAEL